MVVLGTPAEEGGQGKVYLLEKGAFDGADVAVMAHPTTVNVACPITSALARVTIPTFSVPLFPLSPVLTICTLYFYSVL